LTDIPKGSFIANYMGKVMLNKEADKVCVDEEIV